MPYLDLESNKKIRSYEILTWSDVAEKVRRVNPGLSNVIDEIDPPKNWKIVKVRYAFGDEILRKGELFIPHNNVLVGIEDPEFNFELSKLLSYSSMPIGLTTHSTMELFIDYQEKIIPFSLMLPGKIFALWIALDANSPFHGKIWNMVAGTRALFFLPKITDAIALKKLGKVFNINFQTPRSFWDQWFLLKELSSFQLDPWYLETIYFSAEWFKNGPKQNHLRSFLLGTAWRGTSFLRNDIVFDLIYSYAQAEKNIRIDPYLVDIVKHLYALGCGSYPGFAFANSDLSAPINFIKEAFNNFYEIEYSPTLMHTNYFDPNMHTSLFYSLQLPTQLEFSPKSRKKTTNIDALYYILSSMKRLKSYIIDNRRDMQGQELYLWAENVSYQYYHSHPSEEYSIQPIINLLNEEKILKEEELFYKKPFCETNIFMRGLIKLS